MIRPWGDLIGNVENTQVEVDIMKLGLQHTYLDVRFDDGKIQEKPDKTDRENG